MKCSSPHCKNSRAPHRAVCYACKQKAFAARHPERYAYNTLKQNARRRGKEFTLTFEDFLLFCVRTQYLIGKGKTKMGLSVDRKCNEIGYVRGNLQVLSVSENAKKLNRKMLVYDHESETKFIVKTLTPIINERPRYKRKTA